MEHIIIETNRLKIIALPLSLFSLLINGTELLEKEMGLTPSGEELDEHTLHAMKGLYDKAKLHEERYYWYTNWQIILKSENKSIGSACFMEEPNIQGEVEMGYGINEDFRCKGYMTEAATSLCRWAFNQPGVNAVMAETEIDNLPSHRVLEKCGMQKYHQTLESIWWKLEK